MTIKQLNTDDWNVFVDWANAENWRISFQEQRLFQSQWRPCFYVLWHNGERCAFVSAVIYKTSAWIGNLIVHPHKRKSGYGSELFRYALDHLSQQKKVTRVWLTASEQGISLYRQHGFVAIDQVERWHSYGRGESLMTQPVDLEMITALDQRCWGESRGALLGMLADDGCLLNEENTAALLQPGVDFWLLGPWLTRRRSSQYYRQIVDQALATAPQGKEVVTDVLTSSGTALILQQAGFEALGYNRLMCRSRDSIDLTGVVSLASLGSIG